MKYHRDEDPLERYTGGWLNPSVFIMTLNDLGGEYPGWDDLFERAVVMRHFELMFDLTGNLDAPL